MSIFQNTTKSIPTKTTDSFIVRTPMDELQIGGRKDHIPAGAAAAATVKHIPNAS